MARLTVSETRDSLADVIGRVQFGGERVTVMKHGKPVAAIVSAEDLAALEAMEDRELAALAAGRGAGERIAHDTLWAELLAPET
jgi:prevent-host-death family protein